MATKLKNLVITKVALCDEGACSAAHIQLYKRKDNRGGNIMNFEELMKSLPAEQQEVIKAKMAEDTKMLEDKKAKELKDMKDKLDEAETKMSKMKPISEPDENEILKSLDPSIKAIVEKSRMQAEAAELAVKKMREEQDTVEAIAKAKALPCIGEEADITDLYKSIKAVDADVCAKVFSVLEKANTLIEKSSLLEEVGSRANNSTEEVDAWAKIEKAAEAIAKTSNITKTKAISEIMNTQPELYQEYLTQQNL